MSTRSGKKHLRYPNLNFKISFFQDLFTIIEELTGDCPGVGLPNNFHIDKESYILFKELQKRYDLTKNFITNFKKINQIDEWVEIKKIIRDYKGYWNKEKIKIQNSINYLNKVVDFEWFLQKLEEITLTKWETKDLDVFFTVGYKNSGTYDREINVIRVGIHEGVEKYLVYTLYHELIHYHIVKHMKLKLSEGEEEILCRAIFKLVFEKDLIAQKHWQENLSIEEIKKINKKSEEVQYSL